MRLKQLMEIVQGDVILMAGCLESGRYIGKLNDELYEEYKNCKVSRIERGYFSGFPIEIRIVPTKSQDKKLCKTCYCDTCSCSPQCISQI